MYWCVSHREYQSHSILYMCPHVHSAHPVKWLAGQVVFSVWLFSEIQELHYELNVRASSWACVAEHTKGPFSPTVPVSLPHKQVKIIILSTTALFWYLRLHSCDSNLLKVNTSLQVSIYFVMSVTSASLPLFGCPPSGKVFVSATAKLLKMASGLWMWHATLSKCCLSTRSVQSTFS